MDDYERLVTGRIDRKTYAENLRTHMGERVRQCRENAGYSEKEFAAVLGVSKRQLKEYERGKQEIPLFLLRSMVDKLGVSAQYLVSGLRDTEERKEDRQNMRRAYHDPFVQTEKELEEFFEKSKCEIPECQFFLISGR